MNIKHEQIFKYTKTKNNMIRSNRIIGSHLYKKSKIMSIMNSRYKSYLNQTYKDHIEDIEQTLIDYGILDENLFISLWVSNCDIPIKKRTEMFSRDIVKLSFGFNRYDINQTMPLNKRLERKKFIDEDIVTLHLAKYLTEVNYSINNYDSKQFKKLLSKYDDFYEMNFLNNRKHNKMWEYLEYLNKDCMSDLDLIYGYW